jgi:serine/threonine-protein kinase
MAAHLEKTPVPPITLDTNLPQALNDVILMAIVKEPDQRFQSAQAFAAALGSVRQSLGLSSVPVAAVASDALTMPLTTPASSMPTAPLMPASPQGPAAVKAPPAPPAAEPKSSKRWLWVSAGALATVLALVALIQFGPWRKNAAQAGQPAITTSVPPTTTTTPPPPVVTPPEQPAPTPAQTEMTPPVQMTPPNRPAQKPPVRQTARHATGVPAQNAGSPPQPSTQQSAPAAATASAEQTTAPDPAEVLQDLRERLVQLGARAGAIRTSLGNLKRAQEASGMSLRGDMVSAESRMNYLMDGANSALGAHDPRAAKKFIDSAEIEVEKLEKFLGI